MEAALLTMAAVIAIGVVWLIARPRRRRSIRGGPGRTGVRVRPLKVPLEEMERLLEHMDEGVLFFNELLTLVQANPARAACCN